MRIKFINTYGVNLHKSHYIKYYMKYECGTSIGYN